MTRTFVSLEMHAALQRHLAGVIRQMARALPHVHWVNPASIHLTLAFLGELDESQLSELIRATELTARESQPFSYRLTQPGIFGSPRQPRVIWMGLEEPTGRLTRVHHLLNVHLIEHGFAVDQRSFSPHFTLARIKAPLTQAEQQSLQTLLTGNQPDLLSADTYTVQTIHVMKCELSSTGAHYTSLYAYQMSAD